MRAIFNEARKLGLLKTLSAITFALSASASVFGQESLSTNAADYIKNSGKVTAHGPSLFGDQINLYTGSLQFAQQDFSVPGNTPLAVAAGRIVEVGKVARFDGHFGEWEMEIPRLHGDFSNSIGWAVDGSTDALKAKRCSNYGAPPTVAGTNGSSFWDASEYWHGTFMYIPGLGDQELLLRSGIDAPTDGLVYPISTKGLWTLTCLPSLANGGSTLPVTGEGFLAVSPDGTRYRFDWMVKRPRRLLTKASDAPAGLTATNSKASHDKKSGGIVTPSVVAQPSLTTSEYWILPTLITDSKGNTVTYSYDSANPWNVLRIDSSDGRYITFTYVAGTRRVLSASDGSRTYYYSYRANAQTGVVNTLDRVTQPGGSAWTYSLDSLTQGINGNLYVINPDCASSPGVLATASRTGTLTHPSGATASFTLTPTAHGRSQVGQNCIVFDTSGSTYAQYPKDFATFSLTAKTLSGPGIGTLSWNYSYGPANSSWAPCSGCAETKTVFMTDPANSTSRYIYANKFQETEGQLLQIDEGWNGATALRTTVNHYRNPTSINTAVRAGWSPQDRGDGEVASRFTPIDTRTVTQQGTTFNWVVSSFEPKYYRPATVVRSGPGTSRTETTTYNDYPLIWALGRIGTVTEASGKVITANTYNTGANLLSTSHFGKLQETYTYYTNGTLATRADGFGHATTYANYKRGIAQLVTYPDGATQTAVVNDIGQITSLTGPDGFPWSFGYDAMGLLSQTNPPTGDPAGIWNPTTQVFEAVTVAEYGLPPGHWRQTVSTGNARTITYYDALWRRLLSRVYDQTNESNTLSMVLRRFDADGRNTFASYPSRSIAAITDTPAGTTSQFDALGRPTSVVANSELGALTTSLYYDAAFKTRQVNPRGYTTTTGFVAWDAPESAQISTITAPEGITISINRNAVFGYPDSVIRSGGGVSATRSYVYDANLLLCKTVEPETGATIQSLDAANNLSWRATGQTLTGTGSCDTASVPTAAKTSFGYDTRNRLLSTSFGDASPGITRTYKADGLPATVISAGTTWSYDYNTLRLLSQETLAYNAQTYGFTRNYNANGQLNQLVYGPANLTVSYNPNALGQPTQAGSFASNVLHHPNGAIASYTLGNGITHSLTQNTRGLPATNTDGNVLQDVYTYDANANVTGIADQIYGKSRGMAYDGQDRLSTTNAPNLWGNGSFSYNALDNLTASTLGARNSSHNYDSTTNRLQSINTNGVYTGFSFDAQGNVTAKGSQGYVFDQANRLKLASGPANTTYTYDGLGRRVFATASSTSPSRTTVYSQAGQVLYSTAQAGTVVNTTSYVYLGGKLIGEEGTTGRVYSHTDALGSPVARTNQAAQFISNTWYEPYGKTAGGVQPQLLGFTGHVNDIDTGLVYMQQRYYDPVAGRFLSVDPVTTDAESGRGFGRYHYAENNPYKFIDPDGRFIFLAAAVPYVVGAVTAAVAAHYAAPGREGREQSMANGIRSLANAVKNESAEAPAAADKPAGDKPTLESNPKHHPNSVSPEPSNVDELYDNSAADSKGVRWAKDEKGELNRFSKPSNGQTHWNGTTDPNTVDPIKPQNISNEIKKLFGYK